MAQPAELSNPPPSGDTIAAWLADVPKWVAYDLALIKKDDGAPAGDRLPNVIGWLERTETTDKLVHYSRYLMVSKLVSRLVFPLAVKNLLQGAQEDC